MPSGNSVGTCESGKRNVNISICKRTGSQFRLAAFSEPAAMGTAA